MKQLYWKITKADAKHYLTEVNGEKPYERQSGFDEENSIEELIQKFSSTVKLWLRWKLIFSF